MANLSNINNKFLVTTGGNVLIGKTAVTGTSKLQVSGSLLIGTDISSGIPLVVQETTADGFAIGFMRNTNATNGNGLVIDVNSTAGAYIQDWRQASTVKMRLLQNGNLGIGTDSPDFALDIEAVSSGVQLQIGRTNTSAGSTWMGSDSNGFHLGVGTYGAGNSVTDPNGFTVLTSGNVGIGTVSPTSKLDISDAVDRVMNSNGEGQFEITGNGYTFGIAMGNTTTALYHNSDVRSLTLGTNETPRLTILGGGNVGIGNSPASDAKLEVWNGNLRVRGDQNAVIQLTNVAGNTKSQLGNAGNEGDLSLYTSGNIKTVYLSSYYDSYINPAGGNVGIGITNPQDKLHVNGDAIISSTRFGDNATASINTTGIVVANVVASTNGQSAVVEFIATGGAGAYYNVVYTCYNGAGNWYYTKNVVGSGGNIEVAETNGSGSSTLVFYFRATSGVQGYTPRVMMKASPYNLVTF